jgi:outer membrane protein OmpA-like peptidoglycan-associated protein
MLDELLRHIRCKRLEAGREKACGQTAPGRVENGGVRTDRFARKAPQPGFCPVASRSTLLKQLNAILETHDTAHGLVAALSDELFDQFRLRPVACQKLERITHFLLAHPGIRLRVEVHTTRTGSEKEDEGICAERVWDLMKYFVSHGVPDLDISVGGLVRADGIHSHNSPCGRQARQIELVVPGKATGTKLRGAAAAA